VKGKVIILGAGIEQIPIIHCARSLGLYVVTVDNIPGNVGHEHSDKAIICSTVDIDGVRSLTRSEGADGIVTYASDVALAAVAAACADQGWPGPTPECVATLCDKEQFREFQRAQHMNAPRFRGVSNFEEFYHHLEDCSFPIFIKPTDSSGSKGISVLDGIPDLATAQRLFNEAMQFSRKGRLVVESAVPGEDISADGWMNDGEVTVFPTCKHSIGCVPVGHSYPSKLNLRQCESLRNAVSEVFAKLGYDNGPFDVDARVREDEVTILELAPRLGGNGIPLLIQHAWGLDLIERTLAWAINSEPSGAPPRQEPKACGSHVVRSDYDGILRSGASWEALRASVPEVFYYKLRYRIGSRVPAFKNSANSIGIVLFDVPSEESYWSTVDRCMQAIALDVAATAEG
jgi:biotin carboxylase